MPIRDKQEKHLTANGFTKEQELEILDRSHDKRFVPKNIKDLLKFAKRKR